MSVTSATSARAATAPDQVEPGLLQHPAFVRLWTAQTISLFGDQVTLLALPLAAVLLLGAGPTQMGLLTAAGWAPHLVLSLVAGTWIDQQHRRRRIMIAADIARAGILATIPLAYLFDVLTLGQLYLVAFMAGVGAVFFDQTWSGFFVTVVPRRLFVLAQSRLSTSRAVSQVGGPSLAGTLVSLVGAPAAIAVDAASFIASAFFVRSIRIEEPLPPAPDGSTFWSRTKEGFTFIFGHPLIRAMVLCVTVINFFNLMFTAIFVLYASRELGLSPGVIGLVFGVGALGGVAGALLSPRAARWMGIGPAIILGAILFPGALLIVPATSGPEPIVIASLVAAMFIATVGVMFFDVNLNSVSALVTPYRLRARSAGSVRLFGYGCRPLGALLGGYLGTTIGLRETMVIAGAGALLGVFFLIFSPFRTLHDEPPLAE